MSSIFIVTNDRGLLEMIFDNRSSAEAYIDKYGNENFTIDEEDACQCLFFAHRFSGVSLR